MLPGRQLTIEWALGALLRRRWLLIVPLFLGVLGGLLFSRFQPSLYRSDAMVEVVPQRIPDSYVQSTVTSRVEDRLTSIAQQVLSRTQMEAVITKFNLYPEERRKHPMEDVFELMTSKVTVMPVETAAARRSAGDPQVDAFRISFEYENPRIARDVVAELATFFINTNARERGSQADQTSAFLDSQLAEARGQLEASDKRLKEFRERNSGRLPTQMQTNMQAIQTTQLALQAMVESLARDRDRKLVLERLLNDASADPPVAAPAQAATPATGGVASRLPANATPRQRLEAANAYLAQLEIRFTANHPDVKRLKSDIADLEKQVAAEDLKRPLSPDAPATDAPVSASPEELRRRDNLRAMRAEIESLDRQIAFKEGEEKRMRAEIAAYQARLEAVPGVESEWVALTRDLDTLQAKYREILSKSENSKMSASLEQRQIGEQFRLLDPPRVPPKPASPNRIRINVTATLAGLGVGLLLVGLMEYQDSTMRSEADVLGAMKGLPVLALLPFVTTDEDLRLQKRRRVIVSAAVVLVLAGTAALAWFLQLWKFVV
jgi:polysaccharide chain length determinant protein (PEP-CTERM system associated)